MGHRHLIFRSATYTALLVALSWLAPSLALAGAVEEPEARWYLPTGHWAYMCCDYLEESGVIAAGKGLGPTHFDGDQPVLLSDFAREIQNLVLALRVPQEQSRDNSDKGLSNATPSAALPIPPLREIACDLSYEIYGLANARDLLGNDSSLESHDLQPQLEKIAELWTQFGDADHPLASAMPGANYSMLWSLSPLAESQQWAGLEVIGLIRLAKSLSRAHSGEQKNREQPAQALFKSTDWQYTNLMELLDYTHNVAVEQLNGAPLPRVKAVELYDTALAALRELPDLDSHIVLTAWDLGEELSDQPGTPDSLSDRAAAVTDFGGLAMRCHTTLNAGVPISPYGEVPAGHWMYQALDELSRSGWLRSYPEGFFRSGRLLKAHELAIAAARLREDLEDPAQPCRNVHVQLLAAELHAATLNQLSKCIWTIYELPDRKYYAVMFRPIAGC